MESKITKRDIYLILSGVLAGWVPVVSLIYIIKMSVFTFGMIFVTLYLALWFAKKVDEMDRKGI